MKERPNRFAKHSALLLLALLLFAAILPATARAEPANFYVTQQFESMGRAGQIPVNVNVVVQVPRYSEDGEILGGYFTNFFKLDLQQDGYIYSTTDESGLVVYDKNERFICDLGTWRLGLAAGTYYIASGFEYNVATAFHIGYAADPDYEAEPNDSRDAATPIEPNSDTHGWLDSSTSSGTDDYLTFVLPEDGYVDMGLYYDFILDDQDGQWQLDLLDADGEQIVNYTGYSRADDPTREGFGQTKVGLAAGRYYIKLWSNYMRRDKNYLLKLRYTPTPFCETEFNEGFGTADAIPVNTPIFATTYHRYAEKDYFAFSLPHDGAVSVPVAATTDGDYRFALFTADARVLEELWVRVKGGATTIESGTLGLAAGTYYLKAEGPHDAPYAFTVAYESSDAWEKEFNDSFATASALPLNAAMHGWWGTGGEDDYYAFTLPENGFVTVESSYVYNKDGSDRDLQLDLYLEPSDEARLCSGSEHDSSGVTFNKVGLTAGTYYLKCAVNKNEDELKQNWYYDLRVEFTPTPYFETEPNTDRATADAIVVDQPYGTTINADWDQDYFTFNIPEDGAITLTCMPEATAGCRFYIDNDELYWGDIDAGQTITTDPVALSAGAHYLRFYGAVNVPVAFCVNYAGVHLHSMEYVEAREATCKDEGTLAHWKCTSCDKLFEDKDGTKELTLDDVVVPVRDDADAHEWGDWKVVTEPTAGQEGREERACDRCGLTERRAIAKLPNDVSKASVAGIKNATYTGKAIKQSPTVTLNGSALRPGVDYQLAYANNTKAGTATVTITGTGDYVGSKRVSFKIAKAAVGSIKKPVAAKLTYTGKTQRLVSAGSCVGGTVHYSLNNKTWSKAIPTGKTAASYKVYWKVVGDASHNGTSAKAITVKIAKATNPLTIKVSSKSFSRTSLKAAKTFAIGASKAQGKLTYTVSSAAKKAGIKVTTTGKVTVPKLCKKGTYTIAIKAAGNANFKAASKTVTIKIK